MSLRGSPAAVAALLAGALLAVAALVATGAGAGGARGSSLSRGPDGWLAARRYLEARGARVAVLRERVPPPVPVAGEPPGVRAVVFPWQWAPAEHVAGLRAHLAAGGDLVLAYSGRGGAGEAAVFAELGFELERAEETRSPFSGRREHLQATSAQGRPLVVPPLAWRPRPPEQGTVLYRTSAGEPAAWISRRGRGRLVVLPAAALDNAGLAEPEAGNADLLETLRAGLGPTWTFDEVVHGLVVSREDPLPGRVVALAGAHLAVLYGAGLWALGRRFGAPWTTPVTRAGSTAAVLTAVGGLHHRLGHHRDAARRALERSATLARRDVPADLAAAVEEIEAAGFTAWIARLARWRRGGSEGQSA